MKTARKKALRFALISVAAGLLISFAALVALDFNFFEMGTMEPVTNTYAVTDAFTGVSVWGAECDVRLIPSRDATCTVLCSETDRIAHTVAVRNGTLIIERTDNRKWFEHIGFMWSYWGPIEVVICLPEGAYEDLRVRTTSGDVEIPEAFSFAQAEVNVVSGDIRFAAGVEGELHLTSISGDLQVGGTSPQGLTVESTSGEVAVDAVETSVFSCKTISGTQRISRLTCQRATVNSTSGSVIASDLIASENIRMEAVSGSLELTRCDADTLWLKTVSGSVTGTLRTAKVFDVSTTSGSVHVPDTAGGGLCEIKTVSGSIHLDVPGATDDADPR